VSSVRRGVTLVEMLVVLLLLAIVSAVTMPAFASIGRASGSRRASAVVQQVLMRARGRALQTGSAVNLTVDPATARYWVGDSDTAKVFELPANAALSASTPRVHFRFEASGIAVGEPLFVQEKDRLASLSVDRFTGVVRIDGQ
jgi:prepilin-type N-terminal cleavage/methylation domain-containing protein